MNQRPLLSEAVTLIVVNYNGEDVLEQCLNSLLESTPSNVDFIIVDNASNDESRALLKTFEQSHPKIQVIYNPENLGYAGAVNRALPLCVHQYVGIFNMDVTVEPDWLSPLIQFLDDHPHVAAVNPLITLEDGEIINAAGQDVHVSGLGFNHGLGKSRNWVGLEPFPISGLQGAAFIIRKSLLEKTHGMDDSGFLYHEDVNLSWLLRLMGHDLYCVPESAVRHDYFLSMHAEKLYLLERNRLAMLFSYLESRTRIWLFPFLILTETFLWSYALLKGPSFLRAKARSYTWTRKIRKTLNQRKALAQNLRVRSDRELLKDFTLGYPLRQLLSLARETSPPRKPLVMEDTQRH